MEELDTSSPTEQILENIDFRINSLSHVLASGVATQDRLSLIERRREIRRRRLDVLAEKLNEPELRQETESRNKCMSDNDTQKAPSESKEETEKTENKTPPSMSEASATTELI